MIDCFLCRVSYPDHHQLVDHLTYQHGELQLVVQGVPKIHSNDLTLILNGWSVFLGHPVDNYNIIVPVSRSDLQHRVHH